MALTGSPVRSLSAALAVGIAIKLRTVSCGRLLPELLQSLEAFNLSRTSASSVKYGNGATVQASQELEPKRSPEPRVELRRRLPNSASKLARQRQVQWRRRAGSPIRFDGELRCLLVPASEHRSALPIETRPSRTWLATLVRGLGLDSSNSRCIRGSVAFDERDLIKNDVHP